MTWKHCGLVLVVALLVGEGGGPLLAEAATAGIPGVVNAAALVKDTIQVVVSILGTLMIIGGVFEMRHGVGFGSIALAFLGVVVVVAIALFADDIVQLIRPGAAAGAVFGGAPSPAWTGLGEMAEQLGWLTGLAVLLRRARP
jgi:hypothetical protein